MADDGSLPPLDADLRDLVDAFVDETAVAPEAVAAAYAATTSRVAEGSAVGASSTGLVLGAGLVVGLVGLVGYFSWPQAEVLAPARSGLGELERSLPSLTPGAVARPDLPSPSRAVESETTAVSPTPPKPRKAPPSGDASTLAAELELLRDARRALRSGNAKQALGLVGQHAERYPSSSFAEERSATQVMALCKLGRSDQARMKAKRFRQKFPHSSFEAGLIEACEDGVD